MITSSDITNIIIALFPFIVLLAGLIYRYVEKHMPHNVLTTLLQLATIAVQMVEQQQGSNTSQQKKAAAIQQIEAFFQAVHLPVPSDSLVGAAIERAVYILKQEVPTKKAEPSSESPSPPKP